MRFLEVVVRRNDRRLRIEDLLLLLLRCLLLALLALALARPAFRAAAGMAPGAGARTVVIALDNSYSMGLTDGGASRFDNARKAAGQIVDGLPVGSAVALLEFSDVARTVIAEPATDLNLVRKMIGDAALTDRASNVHPALSEALGILKSHAGDRGEVYLITDAQANGWKEMAAMRSEAAAANANIGIVVTGPAEQPNLGVSALGLGSAMVPVGGAARFSAEVTNYGHEPARNVTVGLSMDGEAPGDQAVIDTLPPGESRWVSLFGRARTAGYHAVTAQLPPDHLAADDRRTMVVRALDEVRVLLVAGDMGATPREGDAFFLERALAPDPGYFIKTRTIPAAELNGTKFADFNAVALIDVPRLEPGTVAELDKYVRDGGGLMIFPGEKTNAPFDSGMLPAKSGAVWKEEEKFRSLQGPPYPHQMVSIWRDPAAGTLTTARFYKGVALQPLPGAVTVLDYSDGEPAIVERAWGGGRVIEFSSSANAAWNDLPAHPAFVPLMQRALGRLVTRRDETLNIRVGAAFTWPARAEWLYKEITVAGPGGVEKGKVGIEEGEPRLRYGATDRAGAYRVAIAAEPPAKLLFAAQADPEESKLEALSDAELKTLGPGTQVIHWAPGTDMRQAMGQGGGREFWSVFAAVALGVACCETFLAGRFSAAK